MAIGVISQPQIQQGSSFVKGARLFQAMLGQILENQFAQTRNKFAPESMQAQLDATKLANEISKTNLSYLPREKESSLALQGAQRGLYGSESNYYGAQADQIKKLLPLLLQQEQGKVFRDPILSRLYEVDQAQKTGAIPQNLLSQIGVGQPAQQTQMPSPPETQQLQIPFRAGAQPGVEQLASSMGTPQQRQLPFQPGNQVTPLTAPNMFGGDSFQNYALFGTPINPLQQQQIEAVGKGLQEQQKQGVTNYNTALKEASLNAEQAASVTDYVNQFDTAYDKSRNKGTGLYSGGWQPSSGFWASAFSPVANLSEDQTADRSANNIQRYVQAKEARGDISQQELEFYKSLKVSRNMDPEAKEEAVAAIRASSARDMEKIDFLNSAANLGVDFQTAQNAWNLYNKQNRPFDFTKRKPLPENLGQERWSQYLSPQAIETIRSGKPYMPKDVAKKINAKETVTIQMPNGHRYAVPKDKLKEAKKRGGQEVKE
jgi:hypothetical protein